MTWSLSLAIALALLMLSTMAASILLATSAWRRADLPPADPRARAAGLVLARRRLVGQAPITPVLGKGGGLDSILVAPDRLGRTASTGKMTDLLTRVKARSLDTKALVDLDDFARLADVDLSGEHPHLQRPTLTPTAIHSYPAATHTVPDEVRIVVDRRLPPGDEPEAALDAVRRAVEDVEPWDVTVEPGPFMYPSEVAPDADLVRLLRGAFAAAGRAAVELRYSHSAIDAGYFNHAGTPAVMLGPGEQEMWHTDEESVALDEVALCATVYATAAFSHLSAPTGV
jgi:hypothetical protein